MIASGIDQVATLTRSSLHRCLQRHGISRLPEVEGEKTARRKFKSYPLGYFHIDLAEVRTEKGSRASNPTIDRKLDKERHQVECFFNKLKRFRTIAPRRDKTVTAFIGFVHLAGAMIWLR